MKNRKDVKVLKGVKIPSWALCYLINGDDSGLDAEDKKTVDDWVEKTREGGVIDVCCPEEGEEAYFCSHPAFGLACDVAECDVIVCERHRYPQCTRPCLGQSRFEPLKRTALDGKVWWCVFDNKPPTRYIAGAKFKTRKSCVIHIWQEMVGGRLPFEPDDDRRDLVQLKNLKEVQ